MSYIEVYVMTFSQLNYVMEVSRCGSINKAASKLFVSQSNLSNSIHELEKELDIKIFLFVGYCAISCLKNSLSFESASYFAMFFFIIMDDP